jgi:hypothetical protein
MINQYEDFFSLIDEDKVNSLVDYYQKVVFDRKFISTWKNFYDSESEMMSYIGYYNEASDTLINKIIGCLTNYNEIRSEILGMMDVDQDKDITQVVDKIRTTAKNIDQIYEEVTREMDDIEKLFVNIWQIFDQEYNIPTLPKIPKALIRKDKKNEQGMD